MIEDAAAKFGKEFEDDTPVLAPGSRAGHSPDGEFVAAVLRFTDGSEFRFCGHHEEATAVIAALAGAQTSSLQARVALAGGGFVPEMPEAWSLPSGVWVAPAPEGHVMMVLQGASPGDRAGVRFTPRQVSELHAALGKIIAEMSPAPKPVARH